MDLEKEIGLLKEKIELMEMLISLQEKFNQFKRAEPIRVFPNYPCYPTYPDPWQPWRITYTEVKLGTGG